jgi:GDPmannose 4,6-dehydratase
VAGITIEWKGSGEKEKGLDISNGNVLIEVDPKYFRPTEVDLLVGDASKAQRELGWKHTCSFANLVEEMVKADIDLFTRDKYLLDGGHKVIHSGE